MNDQRPASDRFLLLRVERTQREGSARPIRAFPTLHEAVAAAAELPHQPNASWRPDRVDGVWHQIDWSGRGFSVHRIDP